MISPLRTHQIGLVSNWSSVHLAATGKMSSQILCFPVPENIFQCQGLSAGRRCLTSRSASQAIRLPRFGFPRTPRVELDVHNGFALFEIVLTGVIGPFNQLIRCKSHRTEPLHVHDSLLVMSVQHRLHLPYEPKLAPHWIPYPFIHPSIHP